MCVESWVNFQSESLLTFSMYAKKLWIRSGSNQGLHTFHWISLPPELLMFSTRRLKHEMFVCSSLIYFRTELLTRVKFSRHLWTGFRGPIGDGKWSHHKFDSVFLGHEMTFLGHEMRGPAGTGRSGVSMAGGREGQSARKGNEVKRLRQIGAQMV